MQQRFTRRATPALRSYTHSRCFSTTLRQRGLFSCDRAEPQDPSKEQTDTIGQAKNEEAATPATQQANVIKQQNPGDPGQKGPNPGQTQANMDKGHTPGGLSSKKSGEKSGEEAVNPAVKS